MKNVLFKRCMVGTIILAMIIGAFSFTACKNEPDKPKPAVEYNITQGTITGNGTFTITPQKAKANATVTLTVDTGTLVKFSFKVDGTAVNIAYAQVSTSKNYTFKMPKGNVEVSAEFDAGTIINPGVFYDINKGNVSDPLKGDFDFDPLEAEEGTLVTLTVDILDPEWEVISWTITGNPSVTEVEKDLTYTFFMPGMDVTVDLLLNKIGEDLPAKDITKGPVRLFVDGVFDPMGLEGFQVDFTISPPNPVVVGSTVTLTLDIDPAFAFWRFNVITNPALSNPPAPTSNPNVYTFIMPASDISSLGMDVREANAKDLIAEGTIIFDDPVSGEAPPALNTGNYADTGDSFTAQLTNITGTLNGGNYGDGVVYTFEFTLTANTGWKFLANNPTITINGSAATFALVDDNTATVSITLKSGFGPADPRAPNYAYNRTGYSSGQTPYAGAFTPDKMFDGEDRDPEGRASQHQLNGEGGSNPKFFAVDLGQVRDIGTIRITWGICDFASGNSLVGDVEGMLNYDIKIAPAGYTGAPTSAIIQGWPTALAVNNPNMGAMPNRVRVETHEMPSGTSGRYIAIMRNDGGTEYTDWHRCCEFEVYEKAAPSLIPLSTRSVTNVPVPVYDEAPPAIDTVFTTGANYTATLKAITPAVAGVFAERTAYKYTIELETVSGYRFIVGNASVNGNNISESGLNNDFGYKITFDYEFPATAAGLVGNIQFTAPVTGAAAPALSTGNYASGTPVNFTAQVSSYSPAVTTNYDGGVSYTVTFALAAAGGYTFPSGDSTVLVNGAEGVYTYVSGTSATVSYKFPMTEYAVDAGAVNRATGRTVVGSNAANDQNVAAGATDGVMTTFFQMQGCGNNPGWIALDLGSAQNIGTVRIYWGDGPGADGALVNYDVQIDTGGTPNTTAGNYGDTGWQTIMEIRRENPGKNEAGYAALAYQTLTMPGGTNARWIRFKRADGSNSGNGMENSDWIRMYELQVFNAGPSTATWP